MVLFKRKPVQFLRNPVVEDESTEVWHIPETGEVFLSYDEYLSRMDFYKQRRFICQITGHSGLTYFQALQSEYAGAEVVEQAFPEALKAPILRRVQFQTVSRIDTLVDLVYDEFKAEYYPGEVVTAIIMDERLHGVVREKAHIGKRLLPDGSSTQGFSRYIVSLERPPDHEAVVDPDHIYRDRRLFTKSVLRSFIKKTVTRESWNGAPWLVKHDVADHYRIDTRVPPGLRYHNKVLERKNMQAQKRTNQSPEENSTTNSLQAQGPVRLPELKPAPKSRASKNQSQQQPQNDGHPPGKGRQYPSADADPFAHHLYPSGHGLQNSLSLRNPNAPLAALSQPPPPPPPPPPKYPIEDLQLEPQGLIRPALSFMCRDDDSGSAVGEKILMKSVGPLLETWDNLNVYCEIFKLDSFTFDDFVETMLTASERTKVELFDEIHCAVLKIIVKSEADGGNVEVQLPALEDEDDDEEEAEEEEPEPEPEPKPKPAARATRSSMAKLEAERLAAEAAAAEKENQQGPANPHRADEVLKDFDWIGQLQKRAFKDGGWELIMVGLLHRLSKADRHQTCCNELLAQLVPPEVEPTRETVRQHYAALDINYRAQALQVICMLTAETKAIRGYMEDCSEQMTAYRKEKIEWQRQRKQAIEDLKPLNDQRKILLPDNMPPSPLKESTKVNGDVRMSDVEDLSPPADEKVADSSDDLRIGRNRALRRGADDRGASATAQRKRKREDPEPKKELEVAIKAPKQSKQFTKVLKEIEKKEELIKKCEEEIAVIDNDLREADCPRTRVLGKDRFWNRYYWFERNGMPYGGLPNSSTASAEYANGCIWVQGPDELERLGYIDMAPEYQNEYKAKFNMTVPERKTLEEGPTSVCNATQWGYYSEPQDLDALIHWLDPRGFNESKLRKELVTYRARITKNMEKRKEYLKPSEKDEKKTQSAKPQQQQRMSMRNRTVQTPELPQPRCLQWHNSMALEELGHLHSDQPPPPPPRVRKGGRKKESLGVAEPKKLGRQGTRYSF